MEPNIPDPKILFNHVCNPDVLYTHSPFLGVWGKPPQDMRVQGQCPRDTGFWGQHPQEMGVWGQSPQEIFLGCVLANSIMDPWYWVNPRIFPLYFPYKRKHGKTTEYGIVLYWKRDCESVKRKCSSFVVGCIPSSLWTVIQGLAISLWT